MNTDISALWKNILTSFHNNLEELDFNTWIVPLEPVNYEDGHFIISAPNIFTKKMVTLRFMHSFEEYLRHYLNLPLSASLKITIIDPSDAQSLKKNPIEPVAKTNNQTPFSQIHYESNLNPFFTFDHFICGKNNEFAFASSQAVAKSPGKAYNPLFIWGGVGLGKTHLMQACAHHILKENTAARVSYCTAEKFANELIRNIQFSTMEDFRNKYRYVDVLLIDDIQFIAGKKATQEEFFNTFNVLHELNKQIIITSDKPPQDLDTLEERLRSRFTMGLITAVSPPDYEVRMAILQQMVNYKNFQIPINVLEFIANEFTSDVRELQGALIRITAHSQVTGVPIDLDFAKKSLSQIVKKEGKVISVCEIQEQVAQRYGIRLEDILSKNKTQNISFPRQVSMYVARELTDLSLPKIANEFKRDHTTVLHGVEKIKKLIDKDEEFKIEMDTLIKKIKS